MAIICYPRDDVDFVASDAGAFFATRTSGVYSADGNLAVSINAARRLAVSSGIAWIRTDSYWGKVIVNTNDIYLTLPDADGVLDRICRVVARWDKTANELTIILRNGELGATPVAPERNTSDELYELVLADYLVEHGETAASAARLTDQRLNEDLCGLMRDGVTRIPSDVLYAQAQALIASIEAELANAESGTAYELKRLQFNDVSILPSAWAAYTPSGDEETALAAAGYTQRAAVVLSGVLSTMTPVWSAGIAAGDCGAGLANQAQCYSGGIYFYADSVPSSTVIMRTIMCWKAVA